MQNFIDNQDYATEFNTMLVARRQLATITAKAVAGDFLTKYEQNFLTRAEYQNYAELRTSLALANAEISALDRLFLMQFERVKHSL